VEVAAEGVEEEEAEVAEAEVAEEEPLHPPLHPHQHLNQPQLQEGTANSLGENPTNSRGNDKTSIDSYLIYKDTCP
jgi:hypothetical protein